MKKRIVVCADGTWNRPEKNLKEDVPTNVIRLARAVSPVAGDGMPQQVFYDWGLGSYHDEWSAGTMGSGIHKNIMDGYRYIVQNYSPGDELFLFGFSRGAYTVRSLCGLINNCGILKRQTRVSYKQLSITISVKKTSMRQKAQSLSRFGRDMPTRPKRFGSWACSIRWGRLGFRFLGSVG